jgi:arsenite methyltransferase
MKMTTSSSDYFAQVAGQWDQLRAGFFTEAVRESAISKANLNPESIVADIGGGTGFLAAGLAPRVRKVYLLDGSPAMIEVARQNLCQYENIEYHVTDSQLLSLPDASVDAAFANMYLHHCPDPLDAIRSMTRILKPGGILVITDMDSHSYTWLKEEMADEWMGFEREQVSTWFHQAGLIQVTIGCTGQSCCAESQDPEKKDREDRSARISVFVAVGTRPGGNPVIPEPSQKKCCCKNG